MLGRESKIKKMVFYVTKNIIHYYTLDGERLNQEDLNRFGSDYRAAYEFLKDYYIDNEAEYPIETETIDLHQEGIFDIDFTLFKNFPNLKQLILGYNIFMFLDLSPLSECKKIEELFFDKCGLVKIDLSALAFCPKFRSITLRSNILEELDLSAFADCPNLKSLDVDDNRLKAIDLTPLANCPKLQYLALDNNQLLQIDLEPMRNCTALEVLYLNYNGFDDIELSPLANCKNLKELRLDNNLYDSLDVRPLAFCPNLKRVFIDDVEIIEPEEGLRCLQRQERKLW